MTARTSRKRAGPGASPTQSFGGSTAFPAQATQSSPDQYLQWEQGDNGIDLTGYGDSTSTFAPNLYANMANQAIPQEPSNQLTRRSMNTMMPKTSYGGTAGDTWADMGEGLSQQASFSWMQTTDEEKLDEEAQEAMEAARKSRKSIPPFVQKLRR